MTIDLALEYIPRRMEELGYGSHYCLRFRHLVLQPGEETEIQVWNELFLLVEEKTDVRVESDSGLFDLSADNLNEQQYEHWGPVKIRNQASSLNHFRFIQVIPKNKVKANGKDNQ